VQRKNIKGSSICSRARMSSKTDVQLLVKVKSVFIMVSKSLRVEREPMVVRCTLES